MTRRADLTVQPGGENSLASYWKVAPADAPHSVVCVSWRAKGACWLCHTCYKDHKPYACQHIKAVEQYLAEQASDQRAASAAAA